MIKHDNCTPYKIIYTKTMYLFVIESFMQYQAETGARNPKHNCVCFPEHINLCSSSETSEQAFASYIRILTTLVDNALVQYILHHMRYGIVS
jgi:hypothetical protein